jgi:hypothetical protein
MHCGFCCQLPDAACSGGVSEQRGMIHRFFPNKRTANATDILFGLLDVRLCFFLPDVACGASTA